MPSGFELSPTTAGAYLRRRGVLPAEATPSTRTLGGGVSNRVVEVRWEDGCLVVKQPLPNLAVEDDWPADVGRVHNEAAAARVYADVIEESGLAARVPAVTFEDADEHVIAVECAPAGATMWKRELLEGHVDVDVARAVGDVLGAVHAASAGDADLRETFASKRPFEQLRVSPYHRTTARRHPDVRDRILQEADRVIDVDRVLVHGDYSPKNVLVDRTNPGANTDADRDVDREASGHATPWILDFEVAHWGDPAFDTAFMCNHLFIKAVHNHEQLSEYLVAAETFWDAYTQLVPWDVEADTVVELAVLMLARVDGKSPVEYVVEGPVADALRTIAKRALLGGTDTLDGFASLVREEGPR